MAKKYLDNDGVLYFWQKIKTLFVPTTRTINGKALSSNISLSAGDVNALPDSTSIPSKTSDLTNDSGFITSADIPEGAAASSTTPKMDGTAAVGTEKAFARGDHVHPSDTSRVPITRTINGVALNQNITIYAGDIPSVGLSETTLDDDLTYLDENKVDAVDGKGLSTNDYTTTEKNKLAGIAAGAEVNVQSDWNVTDNTSDAFIKNKPTIPAAVTVDSALSDTSTNPVQNKIIKGALDGKVDKASGLGLSRLYSANQQTSLEVTVYEQSGGSSYSLLPTSALGYANGVCPLDANKKVDAQYLPSYVDDVIEAYARSGQTALSSTWLATGSASGTVITPEAGKIYVLMADSGDYAANTQFRWGGTVYVKLSDGGVTSITNAEIDTIIAS